MNHVLGLITITGLAITAIIVPQIIQDRSLDVRNQAAGSTCRVQGFKSLNGVFDNNTVSNFGISVDGTLYESTQHNPYAIDIDQGTHTISLVSPIYYNVGHTVCYNDTSCHGGQQTPGHSLTVNCSSGFIDLWWHVSPKSEVVQYENVIKSAQWDILNNSPIMYPGGGLEGDNIYAPEVIKEGNIYKMWYGGIGPPETGERWKDQIFYAESSDGITWDKKGVVIRAPSNAAHLNDPSVVKVNGTYYMYYTANLNTLNGVQMDRDVIFLSTSPDGIHWTPGEMVMDRGTAQWEQAFVARPSVLYQDGIFKMWYDAVDADRKFLRVGHATSVDGVSWDRHPANPLLFGGAIDVDYAGGIYIMAIQDQAHELGTYWATSPDGIYWELHGELLGLTGGPDDRYGHVTPQVYVEDGIWKRVYFGGASIFDWTQNRIFVAENLDPVCTVQGFKVRDPGKNFSDPDVSNTAISTLFANSRNNPYHLSLAKGTYGVNAEVVNGYDTRYSLCINENNCHDSVSTVQTTVEISCNESVQYADLWWHYSQKTPTPAPTMQGPTPFHSVCDSGHCVAVAGEGASQCVIDRDCIATPTPTQSPTPTNTPIPTATPTFTPSPTPTATHTPTPTSTPTPIPTSTPVPPTPTFTPIPTATPTFTPTPTPQYCSQSGSRFSSGDADCDGSITLVDFSIWKNAVRGSTQESFKADFDRSGHVNVLDYSLWLQGYIQ